jgi:hypothetical protein
MIFVGELEKWEMAVDPGTGNTDIECIVKVFLELCEAFSQ